MEIEANTNYREYQTNEGEGMIWHAAENPWTTSVDSKLSFLGSHLLAQNMLRHIETWQVMRTPGMGDWSQTVKVYKKYNKTREEKQKQVNTLVLKKQIKKKEKMLKQSGSRVQKCDKGFIRVGDKVRIRRSALLKRKVKDKADLIEFNSAITFSDGTPQYGDRIFIVHCIVQDKEGQNRYLMKRENVENNEDDLRKAYRRMDICRLSGVNVGDIVRISNVQTIGQFRAFKASAKTNSEFRNRTAQEWSSSLFMVTHLKGDPIPAVQKPVGESATVAAAIAEGVDTGILYGTVPTLETKALFDEPGVSPGIFLTPVWEAWKPYGKQRAVFGSDGKNYDGSGGLWWESMQSLTFPTNGRPHSLGYYLAQQERIAYDPVKYYDKDRFRGFQGEELARVDANTQERFAPYHGPSIATFIGNALDPYDEFAHEVFIDNKDEKGQKNKKAPKIYGRLNAVIEPNPNRMRWMERNAEKYSACIHKIQRSVATVSRSTTKSKKEGRPPPFSSSGGVSWQNACEHSAFAVFMASRFGDEKEGVDT